jgi:HEAT repeat protein
MANRGFDEQVQALDMLRGRPADAGMLATLRKALADRNNFVVAKAAQVAEENKAAELLPEFIAAFERFFTNGLKSDPQCWAKNALSRALANLGCTDKDVFLRGLHFRQMEPVWGGRSDSAGTLRATCAHALLGCDALPDQSVLLMLTDLLADPEKQVRTEAVRAIARIGAIALPVLRLRALIPGEDTEVLGTCFHALLQLDSASSIAFVARFLEAGNDISSEAAFALAETRSPDALNALIASWGSADSADPWFAGVLVNAIAMTRLPAAANHLIELIANEDREAPTAIEALTRQFPDAENRARLTDVVDATASPRLVAKLREHLPREAG